MRTGIVLQENIMKNLYIIYKFIKWNIILGDYIIIKKKFSSLSRIMEYFKFCADFLREKKLLIELSEHQSE